MAIVKLNGLIQEISGNIGGIELYRNGDKIIAREGHKAFPTATPSRQQNRQRFAQAAAYGRSVQASPGLSWPYLAQARAKIMAPYHIALKDALNAPEITEIDMTSLISAPGCPIRVAAEDDFEVMSVSVSVCTVERQVLEEGEAIQDPRSGLWVYTTRAQLPPQQTYRIEATAADRPGNTGSRIGFWWVE
jgi:hypothetical protein